MLTVHICIPRVGLGMRLVCISVKCCKVLIIARQYRGGSQLFPYVEGSSRAQYNFSSAPSIMTDHKLKWQTINRNDRPLGPAIEITSTIKCPPPPPPPSKINDFHMEDMQCKTTLSLYAQCMELTVHDCVFDKYTDYVIYWSRVRAATGRPDLQTTSCEIETKYANNTKQKICSEQIFSKAWSEGTSNQREDQ